MSISITFAHVIDHGLHTVLEEQPQHLVCALVQDVFQQAFDLCWQQL